MNDLKLIVLDNIKKLGLEVDEYLKKVNGTRNTYIMDVTVNRFNNGEGKVNNIDIIPLEEVKILYKKINDKPNITYELNIKELEAPLKKGNKIGKLKISKDNNYFKTINVTVSENVDKINIFEQFIKNLKQIFMG